MALKSAADSAVITGLALIGSGVVLIHQH